MSWWWYGGALEASGGVRGEGEEASIKQQPGGAKGATNQRWPICSRGEDWPHRVPCTPPE